MDWPSILIGAAAGALLSSVAALFAVSLFQARVDRLIFRWRMRTQRGSTSQRPLDGIWESRYEYTSAEHPETKISEHFVLLKDRRGLIDGRSLPKPEGSTITFHLERDDPMVTGRWREFTSKERLYHGCVQFEISRTRDSLEGVWTGYSRTRGILNGRWALRRVSEDTGRHARRAFSDRRDLR